MNDLAFRELARQAVNDNQDAGLVLADALLERGDKRGELIALEHALKNSNGNTAIVKRRRNKLAKKVEENLDKKFPNIKILDHWNGFPTDIVASQGDYDRFNQSTDANSNIKVRFARKYDVVKGRYTGAVHELREILEKENNQVHPRFKLDNGNSIYRPLTLEESFEARVINYWTFKNLDGSLRTEEERKRLFNDYQDSCTGIAYQKPDEGKSLKFKIDPENKDLIILPENFNEAYRRIDYDKFPGEELERDGSYNRPLLKSEFLGHDFLETIVPDQTLRTALGEIIYDIEKKSPGFYILGPNEISEDQLRALYVYHLGSDSDVYGRCVLGNVVHFLRVAQEMP